MNSQMWIEEVHGDYTGQKFRVDEVLYSKKSEFQTVDVVTTRKHGNMLLNDGLIMVTEMDEFIYHDMITHIPLFTHPNPKNVLIIGGGDGGTAREVLRHKNIERCVMVEIDAAVVEAAKLHLPTMSCSFDDPKLELLIDDGVKFVKETKEKFDVILIDSTDPIGPAAPLFGPEFYNDVKSCLAENGIVVSQGESPMYEPEIQEGLLKVKSEIFEKMSIYNFCNLTYPGAVWSFSFASNGLDPIKDFDKSRVIESGLKFKYYTPELHIGCFAIPAYQLDRVGKYLK